MVRDYSLTGAETRHAIELGLADAEWYRSPVPREKMREILIRKNGPAIRDTLIWFGLIIGSGYLFYRLWGSWYAIFPYLVYSVLYASTSDSRWHESSHGTAFRTDWMNNVLYEIASFMVFRQSTVWRWSHTRHHSDTIIRGRDPEIAVPRPPQIKKLILSFFGISGAIPEMKRLLTHASGRIDPQAATYVPEGEYRKVFIRARIYLLIYLAVIALSVIYRSVLPLMYIGLPTLLGSWLMPVYGFTQHAGLQENVLDHRLNCRTVYMNRIHRFLYWNMNYHVEHHMFPLVPYHALPRLHELVRDDCPKPYKGLFEAWREIIPAILKQRKDTSYYVERKLPERSQMNDGQPDKKFTGSYESTVNGITEVCESTDLPNGAVIPFEYHNRSYAVCRTSEGELFATDGKCTHGGALLGEGTVVGDMIECPKHNGRFSLRDGSPQRIPVRVGIRTFKAIEENGRVSIVLPDKGKPNEEEHTFRVISNNNLTPFIKELIIETLNDETLMFHPGQYVDVEIPSCRIEFSHFRIDPKFKPVWESMNLFSCYTENKLFLKRAFSMANIPSDGKQLKFNVKIALPPSGEKLSAGAGSSYLFDLRPGNEIRLAGPFGDFQIRTSDREMVYIGGGTGMAPIRSHLEYLFDKINTRRWVSYWYGARSAADLYYLDYFNELAENHSNFSFHVALSEPSDSDNWDGLTGFIHDVAYENFLRDHSTLHEVEFYLCGPPPMIRTCLDLLARLGVADGQIRYDEF